MWWRFWRRRRDAGPPAQVAPPPADAVPRAAGRDDEERPGAPARAFSGATPDPGANGSVLDAPGLEPPSAPRDGDGGRQAVVELVTAALAQDRDAVHAVLDHLGQQGARVETAALSALAALGPRLLVAADVAADDALGGGLPAAAAVTQADTLADRAERLRTTVAPEVRPGLLREVARHAVGEDAEAGAGADARQLLLAAAVLLAQTCRDGQGGPEQLAAELDLLDG